MPCLNVKMLGRPKVKIGEEVIEFPYKKVEGLLYYLLLEKKADRNKVASLLWGDMTDSSARKNLRNALYQLRKSVGKDFVLSPNRFKLEINDEKNINSDLHIFLGDSNEKKIEIYEGEFLTNFTIRGSLAYSDWLREQRNHLHKLYVDALTKKVKSLQENDKNSDKLILYLNKLIEADIFNEDAYRKLMQIY